MARLIDVPPEIAEIAAAALARRASLGGGGTARGVVIATALTTRVLTEHERAEIVRWHARNPDACGEAGMKLVGGMYGGLPARELWEPRTAAAGGPDYLSAHAERVKAALPPDLRPADDSQDDLYRSYALLARAKGRGTTLEDVHDAWSAWKIGAGETDHPALVPFDDLDGTTRALDTPYRDAIWNVSDDTDAGDSFTAAVRAPIANRLAKLSATLNDTDRKLRLRLHAAAEVALTEALRQAAVKVNVKARTAKQKAMVAAAQGSLLPILAAVGVSEQELLDKRFDTLEAAAAVWILAAERRKLRALGTALGLDPDDLDREYDDEMTSRATAAAGFLALGLGIVARSALSGTQPPTQGEQSGPVPFGLVRDTMILGSSRTPAPTIDESGTGPAAIDAISQRLTRTGETLAEELLAREGIDTVQTHTWEVGDPTRPFAPHQDLVGLTWTGDDLPEALQADPGEFPFVDNYSPGDHDGCQCEDVVELAPLADVLV